MDCDTTGIEPDLGLVKMKKLVGGGTMSIVNQTIPRALTRLGYDDAAGRRHHRLHRHREDDRRRPAPRARAPLGVRLLDGRQHHPLRRPRADDGGRAAVPVGRDLQDGEHARGGHRRRRRGAAQLSWELGLKASPSTATTARSASRCRRRRRPTVERRQPRSSTSVKVVEQSWRRSSTPLRQKLPRTRRRRHVRVPCRRLQGLRHGRGVRRRSSRRDLHHRVEAGIDVGGDHGRLRQVDLLRAAVRRARCGRSSMRSSTCGSSRRA